MSIERVHCLRGRVSRQHHPNLSVYTGLCSRTVVTISADKSALEALRMMQEYDISGVAIVNTGGQLLGDFSVSDLRSIMVKHLGALALPVIEFLQISRDMDHVAGAQSAPSVLSACT